MSKPPARVNTVLNSTRLSAMESTASTVRLRSRERLESAMRGSLPPSVLRFSFLDFLPPPV